MHARNNYIGGITILVAADPPVHAVGSTWSTPFVFFEQEHGTSKSVTAPSVSFCGRLVPCTLALRAALAGVI